MKKRILAILCALALVIGMLPVPMVMASDYDISVSIEVVAVDGANLDALVAGDEIEVNYILDETISTINSVEVKILFDTDMFESVNAGTDITSDLSTKVASSGSWIITKDTNGDVATVSAFCGSGLSPVEDTNGIAAGTKLMSLSLTVAEGVSGTTSFSIPKTSDLADNLKIAEFMSFGDIEYTYNIASTQSVTIVVPKTDAEITVTQKTASLVEGTTVTAADFTITNTSDATATVKWYDSTKTALTSAPSAAGTYYIGVSAAATDTYNAVDEVFLQFTINEKVKTTATLSIDTPTKTFYSGTEVKTSDFSYTTNSNGAVSYTWSSVTAPSTAGDYTLTISIAETEEYTAVSKTIDFSIVKIALTASMFDVDETDEIVTGSAITKTITSDLTENTDYTVTYSDNTAVGTATIEIKGIGNYDGTLTYNFTINAKTAGEIVITASESYTYDGSAIVLGTESGDITYTSNNTASDYWFKYTEGEDGNWSYVIISGAPTDVGQYKLTLSFTESTTTTAASESVEFAIVAKSIDSSMFTVDVTDETYDGSEIEKAITTELKETTDYTVTYEDNEDVGTATITIEGAGNYTGTVTYNFEIVADSLDADYFTVNTASETYTGLAITKSISSTYYELGTDYTVAYSNNIEIGTATITISGTGNYTGTLTYNFSIKEIEITSDMFTVDTEEVEHAGSEITKTITSTLSASDYTVSYENNDEVGQATITISGTGNYSGTLTYNFQITSATKATVSTAPTATLVEGMSLAYAVFSGGVVNDVDGNELSGTWSFDSSVVPSMGDTTYTATFQPADGTGYSYVTCGVTVTVTANVYFVVSGTTYTQTGLVSGATPSTTGLEIDTTNDGYTFLGWTKDGGKTVYYETYDSAVQSTVTAKGYSYSALSQVQISATTTYIALYESKASTEVASYTVTFINGTETTSTTIYEGETATYNGTPTKASDVTGSYTFDKWVTTDGGTIGAVLTNVTSNMTVYASYTYTPATYKVTFMVSGVETVVYVNYGETAIYPNGVPTKANSTGYTSTFIGWYVSDTAGADEASLTSITGTTTVYAQFESVANTYDLVFVVNGEVVGSFEKDYNETITTADFTKAEIDTPATYTENGVTYTFSAWYANSDFSGASLTAGSTTVTGDQRYYAKFSETIMEAGYTVNFYAYTGDTNALQTNASLSYGDLITYTGTTPTSTNGTFIGWDNKNDGLSLIYPSDAIPAVTANADYIAVFMEETYYTITFVDEDGTVLSQQMVKSGETITAPDATKASSAQYDYSFDSWTVNGVDVSIDTATANTTYVATYNKTLRSYTVTWIVDGESDSKTYDYGTVPTLNPQTKDPDGAYTYEFTGWLSGSTAYAAYSDLPAVTCDVTYVATFEKTAIKYGVTVQYILNGTVFDYDSLEISYGASFVFNAPEYSGYTATASSISGTMGTKALDFQIVYTAETLDYTLYYMYVDEDGSEELLFSETYKLTVGESYTIETASIPGYTYSEPDDDTSLSGTVTADMETGYIYFEKDSYTVSFEYDGETVETQKLAYGASIVAPETTNVTWIGVPETMPASDITVTGQYTSSASDYIAIHVFKMTVDDTVTFYTHYEVDGDDMIALKTALLTALESANPDLDFGVFSAWTQTISTMSAIPTYYWETVVNTETYTLTVSYTGVDGISTKTMDLAYGSTYSIESPDVLGYTADTQTVTGVITGDTEVDVTYSVNTYALTVNYVYSDGSVAAANVTQQNVVYGAAYSVDSPSVTGYTASETTVTGTMPAENLVVTVYYTTTAQPVLTIKYVDESVYTISSTYTANVNVGAAYDVASPSVTGYVADTQEVYGTMGTTDVTVTVTYIPAVYTVTYEFQNSSGTELSDSISVTGKYGDWYEVTIPTISGYTTTSATVQEGQFTEDTTNVINYTAESASSGGTVSGGDIVVEDTTTETTTDTFGDLEASVTVEDTYIIVDITEAQAEAAADSILGTVMTIDLSGLGEATTIQIPISVFKAVSEDSSLNTIEFITDSYSVVFEGSGLTAIANGTDSDIILIDLQKVSVDDLSEVHLNALHDTDSTEIYTFAVARYVNSKLYTIDDVNATVTIHDWTAGEVVGTCIITSGEINYEEVEISGTDMSFYANLSAVYAFEPCALLTFTDCNVNAWYHVAVEFVLDNGIMNGTSETTFEPNGNTSRAMLVTVLWRMAGEPEAETSSFTDLTQDWYENAVAWAAETGITAGISDTEFAPDENVTREQLATFLYRYAEYMGYDLADGTSLSSFSDADSVSEYAVTALEWAVATGIIQGRTDTEIAPQGEATRAETATMLMRFVELFAE